MIYLSKVAAELLEAEAQRAEAAVAAYRAGTGDLIRAHVVLESLLIQVRAMLDLDRAGRAETSAEAAR